MLVPFPTFSFLPFRERGGPIAAQWGGEGIPAVSHLWQRPPRPSRFAGPPRSRKGRGESLADHHPRPPPFAGLAACAFAQLSRRPIVRLNTSRPGVESWSR